MISVMLVVLGDSFYVVASAHCCGQLGNSSSSSSRHKKKKKKAAARILFPRSVFHVRVFISPVLQQQKNLEGYVGFASLPNQVYRKSVKRGFEFTLMVVGKNACHCVCLCFYMNHFIVVGIYKCSSVVRVCMCVFSCIYTQGTFPPHL